MRELNHSELDEVSGGGLPLVIVGSAVASGVASYINGNSWQASVGVAALGTLSGVTGAMAGITTGIVRIKFGVESVGLAFASGTITGSGQGQSDVGDEEKVLEK